jgi:hypothetical protein
MFQEWLYTIQLNGAPPPPSTPDIASNKDRYHSRVFLKKDAEYALYRHFTENLKQIFPEMKLRGHAVSFLGMHKKKIFFAV